MQSYRYSALFEASCLLLKVPSLAKVIGSMLNAWDNVPRPPTISLPNLVLSSEAKQKGVMLDQHWLWTLSGGKPEMDDLGLIHHSLIPLLPTVLPLVVVDICMFFHVCQFKELALAE